MSNILEWLDRWQQRNATVAFAVGIVKKFQDDQAGKLAALVAYYGFLSVFPLMLLLVTGVGYVLDGRDDLRQQILDSALAQLPVVGTSIGDEVDPLRGNLASLVVGIAGAVWGSMGTLGAAQHALNTVWDVPLRDRPDFLRQRLRSLGTVAVLGAGLLVTVGLANVATAVPLGPGTRLMLLTLTVALTSALFLGAFRLLSAHSSTWRELVPGAVLAGVAWVAVQSLGSLYVTRVIAGASDTYGTFALVIGLISLLFLQAQLTIIAAEVNVVHHRHLWPRSLVGDDLTDADRLALQLQTEATARRKGQRNELHLE